MLRQRENTKLTSKLATIAAAMSLVLVACGGDDDATDAPKPVAEEPAAEEPAAEEPAAEEPATEEPAAEEPAAEEPAAEEPAAEEPAAEEPAAVECGAPGYSGLEPQPLAEPTTVKLSAPAKLEAFAPAFVADANGEFEKENIQVEWVTTQTSVQAMVTGEVDAAFSAPSLEMINAVRQGIDLKWIAGNYYPIPDTEIGLYTSTDVVGEELDFSQLAGRDVSLTNPAGLTLVTLANRLAEHGLSLSDVNIIRLAPADALIALENGAVGAAWLNAPIHREVAGQPGYAFVGGQDPDFVGGGLVIGPSMLDGEEDCEVITALLRAMERTIQSDLAPGYKTDPESVTKLAEVLEIPEEGITSNEELIFTQRIPLDTLDVFQDSLIEFGLLAEADRVPGSELIDQSYLESIEGAG